MKKMLKALTLTAMFHLSLHHHVEPREEFDYVHVSAAVNVSK